MHNTPKQHSHTNTIKSTEKINGKVNNNKGSLDRLYKCKFVF